MSAALVFGVMLAAGINVNSDGKVLIKNPYFKWQGKQVTWIGVSIDGNEAGGCFTKEKRKQCIPEADVAAGQHVVQIALSANKWLHMQPDIIGYDRFVVPARSRVKVDVEAFFRDGGSVAKALTLESIGKAPKDKCLNAFEDAVFAASCSVAELKIAAAKIRAADKACKGRDLRDVIGWSTRPLSTPPQACFGQLLLKNMPQFLTSSVGENFWPIETLERMTSWEWAHTPKSKPETLGQVAKAIDQVLPRVSVVEQLAKPYEDPSGKAGKSLVAIALKAPWSYDPTTSAGHLQYALVMMMGYGQSQYVPYAPAYAMFVAAKAKDDKTLHCGVHRLLGEMMTLFSNADDKLSADEWAATEAMLARTPKDEEITGGCDVIRDKWNEQKKKK